MAFLRKARFQGIMFWWGYGHWQLNHIPYAKMKVRAKRIAQVMPRFKKAGFSTGLNIHTIGFTYMVAFRAGQARSERVGDGPTILLIDQLLQTTRLQIDEMMPKLEATEDTTSSPRGGEAG